MDLAVPDDVRWLVSPVGLAAIDQAFLQLEAGADTLKINLDLRHSFPAEVVPLVIQAAVARRRAMVRWPHASKLVFLREALEQASDPYLAAWRAHRLRGTAEVWDLTAGIGGDALAMAHTVPTVVAVDQDPGRLAILRHNAQVCGVPIDCVAGDALEVSVRQGTAVHVDPSRRRNGTRVSGLGQVQPAVDALLAKHRNVGQWSVATSPAVQWTDPVLRHERVATSRTSFELEFVQVGKSLVEATWWHGPWSSRPASSATIISNSVSTDPLSDDAEPFTCWPGVEAGAQLWAHRKINNASWPAMVAAETAVSVPTAPLGEVLIEVAPAAIRARLHDALAEQLGAWRFDAHRALLTADGPTEPSIWATSHLIETVLPADPKTIRRWLRNRAGEPVELAVYGMNADPVDWWRNIGKPQRGPQGLRIALVRLTDRSLAIVTRRPEG